MTDISLVNPVNVLLSLPTQCYNNKCLPPLWLFTWSELMASCLQGRHLVNWSISSASPSLTHHHFLWMNSDALVDFNLSFFYHSTKLPILSTFFFFYQKSNISERFFFFLSSVEQQSTFSSKNYHKSSWLLGFGNSNWDLLTPCCWETIWKGDKQTRTTLSVACGLTVKIEIWE